jgi:hypothetical protein
VLDEPERESFLDPEPIELPRLLWIGCDIATSFPFHAAGAEFGSTSTENTVSRIVPSSTPTIKAPFLSRSRVTLSGFHARDSILLVTIPSTCGHRDLPGVDAETEVCKSVIYVLMMIALG